MYKLLLFSLLVFLGLNLKAGTIEFKDGTFITKVKLQFIAGGYVVVEKEGKKIKYPVSKFRSYSKNDVKNINSPDDSEYAKYKLKISMEVPGTGIESGKSEDECKIYYKIYKDPADKNLNKIKTPFFYLFIMTENAEEASREINLFYYPKSAKFKGKSYDKIAIKDRLNSFNRDDMNLDVTDDMGKKDMKVAGGDHVAEISIKKIKDRKIIAYHLEVWGTKSMVKVEDWEAPGYKLEKKWWYEY